MSELSQQQTLALILYLFSDQQAQTEGFLQELENELRHNNRFFPQTQVLSLIDQAIPFANHILPKGTHLYRCRLVSKENENTFLTPYVNAIITSAQKHFPNVSRLTDLLAILQARILSSERLPSSISGYPLDQIMYEAEKELTSANTTFFGFPADASDAPPPGLPTAGRINPAGISYLYAAKDIQTAILEVRPIPTQYVSVADIEITQDIRLFSLLEAPELDNDGANLCPFAEYSSISQYFSRPNYSDQSYYLATQYISEYIKHMKASDGTYRFDGLCYASSLKQNGTNYALFDVSKETRKYHICSSALYQVSSLMGDSVKILPPDPHETPCSCLLPPRKPFE